MAIFVVLILVGLLLIGLLAALRVGLAQSRGRHRVVLPLSCGIPILPTQSVQITGRSQHDAFRPERIFISNACTEGGAADWIVNEIRIAGQSQLAQSGDLPGDMFAPNAVSTLATFDEVDPQDDVQIVVTYIGLNKTGAPFFASIVGTRCKPAKRVPRKTEEPQAPPPITRPKLQSVPYDAA